MIRLLKIELLKNLNYRPFQLFSIAYLLVLIGLIFIGFIEFDFFDHRIDLRKQGFYDFPTIWNSTTYIAGLFKIFLGCIIVFSICQEFSNRMFKQNLIDGLGRSEFVLSKVLTIAVLSFISTLIVFVGSLVLGKMYSENQDSALVFKELRYVGNYFVALFSFFSFLLFLSILFRKTTFVFLGLFLLWVGENIAVRVEKWMTIRTLRGAVEKSIKVMESKLFYAEYFPLNTISELLPVPLLRTPAGEIYRTIRVQDAHYHNQIVQYPIGSLVVAILWSAVFILASYWILKKRDW